MFLTLAINIEISHKSKINEMRMVCIQNTKTIPSVSHLTNMCL